ncbi:MAG: hypothetical protein D6813_03575 [Calditrichaeota bacterium]|nr:MAG: hypothetical protein D6813_03575 [Calditrichota bacterium]
MQQKKIKLIWTVLMTLLIIFAQTVIQATTVKPMNLLELANRAEKIFTAKILSIQFSTVKGPSGKQIPCTVYRAKVEHVIKGNEREEITFRFLGSSQMKVQGNYGFKLQIPGIPTYRLDDKILLFLSKESAIGLSAPIGLYQGSFKIYKSFTGKEMVVNGNNNAGLFKNVKQEEPDRIRQFSASELDVLNTRGGAMQLETFISILKKLLK